MKHVSKCGLGLAFCSAACGSSGAPETTSATADNLSAATTPMITFSADWTQEASQALVAGQPVEIAYDPARLVSQCGGDVNSPGGGGGFAWGITGNYAIGGAAPATFQVAITGAWATTPATIMPPTAGDLQIWFSCGNTTGDTGWDSAYGRNYHFPVSAALSAPELDFLANGTTSQSGPIVSGQDATVNYALSRLPECRAEYMAAPAWNILVSWATDGGDAQSLPVTQPQGNTLVSVPVTLHVNPGRNLAVWFYGSDESGCQAYDSVYGANYNFPLAAN